MFFVIAPSNRHRERLLQSKHAHESGVLLIFITLLAYCVLLPCGRLGTCFRNSLVLLGEPAGVYGTRGF